MGKALVGGLEYFGGGEARGGVAAGILLEEISVVEVRVEVVGLLGGEGAERACGGGQVVVLELNVGGLARDLERGGVPGEGGLVVPARGRHVSRELGEDPLGVVAEIPLRLGKLAAGGRCESSQRDGAREREGESVKRSGGHGPPLP